VEELSGHTEEKDEGCCECDGAEDAAKSLLAVDLVEHFCSSDALGFDACDGEVLFLLSEPLRRCGAVRQREEGQD
jgi:hypothetical protein